MRSPTLHWPVAHSPIMRIHDTRSLLARPLVVMSVSCILAEQAGGAVYCEEH